MKESLSKKKVVVVTLLTSFLVLAFFHHALICLGMRALLATHFPKALSWHVDFDSLQLTHRGLALSEVKIAQDFHLEVERICLDFHLVTSPFKLTKSLKVISPKLILPADGTAPLSMPAKLKKRGGLHIERGQIWKGGKCLYFSFHSGEDSHLGTLKIASGKKTKKRGSLKGIFTQEGEGILAQLTIQQLDLNWLLDFIEGPKAQRVKKLPHLQGLLDGQLDLKCGVEGIEDFQGDLKINELKISQPGVQFHVDQLRWKGIFQEGTVLKKRGVALWQTLWSQSELTKLRCKLESPVTKTAWLFSEIEGGTSFDETNKASLELRGILTRDDERTPFTIELSGDLSEKWAHRFSGQLQLNDVILLSFQSQGDAFNEITLHFESLHFPLKQLNYLNDFFKADSWPLFHYLGGEIGARGSLKVAKNEPLRLQIHELCGKQLLFEDNRFQTALQTLEMSGCLYGDSPIEKSSLALTWEGGVSDLKELKIAPLQTSGQMHLAGGMIKWAAVNLDLQGTQALLSFAGPILEPIYQLEMTSDGTFLLSLLSLEEKEQLLGRDSLAYSFLSHGKFSKNLVTSHLTLGVSKDAQASLECTLELEPIKWDKNIPFYQQFYGELIGKSLDERFYGPLIDIFSDELLVGGKLDVMAQFDEKGVRGEVEFNDISMDTGLVNARIKCDQPARFLFSYEEKHFKTHLDFSAWDLDLRDPHLHFDDLCGQLMWDGGLISIDNFTAHFKSCALNGKIRFEPLSGFEIEVGTIKGAAEDALAFLRHFDLFSNWDFPLLGDIEGEKGTFYLLSNFHESFWSLNLNLKNGFYPLTQDRKFCNFEANIQYDSTDKWLQVRNLNGDLALSEDLSYKIEARLLEGHFLERALWNFDLRFSGLTHELIRLVGEIRENEGWELTLGPKTQWFGEKIELKEAHFDSKFYPKDLQMVTALHLGALYSQVDALAQAAIIPLDNSLLTRIAGKLELGLNCSDKGFILHAKSRDFEFNGKEDQLSFVLTKEESQYHLADFVFGSSNLSAHVIKKENFYAIESIDFHQDHFNLTAQSGIFDFSLKKFQLPIQNFWLKSDLINATFQGVLEGDLSEGILFPKCRGVFQAGAYLQKREELYAKSQSPIQLQFNPHEGLILDQLKLQVAGGEAKVDRVTFVRDELRVQNLILALKTAELAVWYDLLPLENKPPTLVEGITSEEIVIEGSLTSKKDHLHFDGEIKALNFKLNELDIQIDHGEVKVDTKSRDLKCEVALLFCGVPLNVDIATRLLKGYATEISIANDLGEKLSLQGTYHETLGLQVDRFFGEFFGLGIDLLANTKINHPGVLRFTGYWHFNFNHFRDILPNSWRQKIDSMGLGRGFELSGDLVLFKDRLDHSYFKGFLKGRDFEIKGYSIRTLLSEVYVSSRQIELSDFCISDEAGLITVPNIRFRNADAKWQYSVPEIRVQDFRPSLLTDIYGQKGKLRPFLIRELVCEKLSGTLGEPQNAKGEGKIVFINTFKRSQNLLDIPIEIIGRIGLDAAILIPVTGEMTFQVSEGRVNFSQLLECFSEGKRSRFSLSKRKPSYLDFDGEFHIDIKMKQYVLLRFTQPFTLSIRGPVDNPRFSLK